MSLPPRPEEPQARVEHPAVIFVVVAILVLGSLFLIARFASGEEDSPMAAIMATPEVNFSTRVEEPIPGINAAPALSAEVEALLAAEQHAVLTPEPAEAAGQPSTMEAAPESSVATAPAEPAVATLTAPVAPPPPPPLPAPPAPPPAPPLAPRPSAPPPLVSARTFAILERSCGAVLWGKDEHARLAPASLTKIITALVVEEQARLNDIVDINVSGSQMARRGSSVMGIEPSMHLSVQDLLYGLLLPSGNDAALALAEHVGGSVGRFVDLMNAEASRLGMYDTHFSNPHGLDSPTLYSSALDMATAGRALLNDPLLARISSTPEYMPAWDGPALKNGNKLLQMYPGSFGVKIGYTTNARQTLVAAAERNGRQIIVSLFGSENRYADSIALFNWAFSRAPSAC